MDGFNRMKFEHFINSHFECENENEKEFVEVELSYPFTNIYRIEKLIWFLKECRKMKKQFNPIPLFIRREDEPIKIIYKTSQEIIKSKRNIIDSSRQYWLSSGLVKDFK